MTRGPLRVSLFALAMLVMGACKGTPTATYDEVPDLFAPKGAPLKTHLRGRVVDFNTLAPIAGVVVESEGIRYTTGEDGYYNLQNLRVGATELKSTKEGYVAGNTILPLNGGDQEFNIRLRPVEE